MSERKWQRRDKRAVSPPPMQVTARDIEMMKVVGQYRVLRQDQLQRLFFGSASAAQDRLAQLYHHGFLNRLFLPVRLGSSPTLYVLDRAGMALVRSELGEDYRLFSVGENASALFLDHTLAVNEVRLQVTLACRTAGYTVGVWVDEPKLKTAPIDRVHVHLSTGKSLAVPIVPDGFFRLDAPDGKKFRFFLEMDRGTMGKARFLLKVMGYQQYILTGGYTKRYEAKNVRVVTVVSKPPRMASLLNAVDEHGGAGVKSDLAGGRVFWFTSLDLLATQNGLTDPLWRIAGLPGSHGLFSPLG